MPERFPSSVAAVAAVLLSACPQGTGDFAPGGGATRLLAPSDQAAPPGDPGGYPEGGEELEAEAQLPPGHPPVDGKETSRELLARVEAMKAQLRERPRAMEIELALGNLYLDNGRYLDAIDWYRQALETAEPGWKKYLALPAPSRSARPSQEVRRACARGAQVGHKELLALAEERIRRGDGGGAAFCLRQALEPSLDALARRGNAWFLAGNPDQGVADHEEVLRRDPSRTESIFFVGAILYDSAGEDLERLRRAREAWTELRRRDPRSPRLKAVDEALPKLEEQIRNGGKRPAPAVSAARGAGAAGPGPAGPGPEGPGPAGAGPGEVSEGAAQAVAQMDVSDPQGVPQRPSPAERNVPAVPAQAEARHLRDLAARGEAAFKKGDYAAAATAWKQVLGADPYLAGELGLRARIAAAEKRLGGGGGR